MSATSIYFESLPYQVDQETGLIDYEVSPEMYRLRIAYKFIQAHERGIIQQAHTFSIDAEAVMRTHQSCAVR